MINLQYGMMFTNVKNEKRIYFLSISVYNL